MDPASFVPPDTFANNNAEFDADEQVMVITPDRIDESFPTKDVIGSHPEMVSSMHAAGPPPVVRDADLANEIPTMYRFLNLVNEQGSNGLVDKVIIAQKPLARFINTICPGAYVSLTDIRFKALDDLEVKPVGVYGSIETLVKFLQSLGVVNEAMAKTLLDSIDNSTGPSLPSGLYIVNPQDQELIYIVYWPEPTTWNDNADESVKRNRVTFMRYLTKITDQVIALVSPAHLNGISTNTGDEGYSDDMIQDGDEGGRLVRFHVSKTNEQEEGVTVRAGFQIVSHLFGPRGPSSLSRGEQFGPELFTPKWVAGETVCAFMTTEYMPADWVQKPLSKTASNGVQLRNAFATGTFILSDRLSLDAMTLLLQDGLRERFPGICHRWNNERHAASGRRAEVFKKKKEQMTAERPAEARRTEDIMRCALADWVVKKFPFFTRQDCGIFSSPEDYDSALRSYAGFLQKHPRFRSDFEHMVKDFKPPLDVKALKYRFALVDVISASEALLPIQKEIARDIILHPGKTKRAQIEDCLEEALGLKKTKALTEPKGKSWTKMIIPMAGRFLGRFAPLLTQSEYLDLPDSDDLVLSLILQKAAVEDQKLSSGDFYARLPEFVTREPSLGAAIRAAAEAAQPSLRGFIDKQAASIRERVVSIRERALEEQWETEGHNEEEAELAAVRSEVVERIEKASDGGHSRSTVTIIEDFKKTSPYRTTSYHISGQTKIQQGALLKYGVYKLHLDSNQKDESDFDSTFVPSPKIEERLSHIFTLPVNARVCFTRVLEGDRVLMIIDHGDDNLGIYLEGLIGIQGAVGRRSAKTTFRKSRVGPGFLVAFNEQKRLLVICSATRPHLHVYNVDSHFSSVKAFGSPVNLVDWYSDSTTTILHTLFICGAEELLLVDSNRQARIYSFTTLQIRPSTLTLKHIPSLVFSSPDGSCFLALMPEQTGPVLRAFHWSTFGTSDGIPLNIPISPTSPQNLGLSSFVARTNVHVLAFEPHERRCRSVILNITTKDTQFTFTQKSARTETANKNNTDAHNSLIDCHSEVWTRFPVVAAVQRKTFKSSMRQNKALTFVADHSHQAIPRYFSQTIELFEQRTQKPTDHELLNIQVTAMSFEKLMGPSGLNSLGGKTSCFLAGEWLVDILCLIPIQIAVARDNRFIPLKDGLFSAQVEQDLLGADVGQIVDALSFGWYESLFQSYQSSKPVKVISSMGEQSVGKSYALNHMVDTSFAGSAMRTTEGVWMAVTPTDNALIVALDFEGVHSIERTAQEDTLLVLFNTALSNLVLFRNNFALSRDITNLFQSFRSSSTVLDPAANPSLFRSTLSIIIKDVVESDKDGIVREFSSKFMQIVREEQGANFITRLHRGNVNIIPWPVIYSRQFYRLFVRLKLDLDNQPVTHPAAGEFLHTMKTLMAKLKANDWGALDNNLAAHRAQQLLSLLPNALKFGLGESDPEEPLKNLDTYEIIPTTDTRVQFYIPGRTPDPRAHTEILATLRGSWEVEHPRQLAATEVLWVAGLATYLNNLVDRRVVHVHAWLTSNLSRFKVQNANTMELQRTYEASMTALRSNVEICKMKCSSCNLLCLKSRLHEADEDHDCATSHLCSHPCDYTEEHEMEQKGCSYPAGHSGKHICKVNAHLCAEPCGLEDKEGCLLYCTKMVDHMEVDGDGHICSASVHMCGERCSLTLIVDGKKWACPGTCKTPTHEQHTIHACENRSCPMQCQLCNRLCSNTDHFHGLDAGDVHLCGQEHSCPKSCSARGICEIQTAPQSIEATFTGRHEVFQYTKYTQVSKRLQCAVPIKRGEISHRGEHVHTLDKKPFHYCEQRCVNCGYFCTLPLGHTQQEHETNHGSMASTRWVVDGADGASLELNGRRFSANDDGAPMMCNLVCQQLGRHVHIDYCRAGGEGCNLSNEGQHITAQLSPNPNRPKDWITHSLNWRRLGFRDPYSREQQGEFAKCDAMCPGQEHEGNAGAPAQPSYCTLPLFHGANETTPPGGGYISSDGHAFTCRNPATMQQAFHVIFVIDRSGSMSSTDRRPLQNTPVSARISQRCNDRLGAVYSALYSFWLTRQGAIGTGTARKDAYSIILFESSAAIAVQNDFTSSPDELLDAALRYESTGGTNYAAALRSAQTVMTDSWSTERTPVILFLSDGECPVNDQVVQDLALAAVRLGKPLSLQTISFGLDHYSLTLRRMADIARDIQRNHDAARDPLTPAAASVESAFSVALDTVQLATTFLAIAESLRKPRGFLLS